MGGRGKGTDEGWHDLRRGSLGKILPATECTGNGRSALLGKSANAAPVESIFQAPPLLGSSRAVDGAGVCGIRPRFRPGRFIGHKALGKRSKHSAHSIKAVCGMKCGQRKGVRIYECVFDRFRFHGRRRHRGNSTGADGTLPFYCYP
jgi:hypothetical protein